MNRKSAGNQIEETYLSNGSIIETAKVLNLKYARVRSYLARHTEYASNRKKQTLVKNYQKDYFEVIDSPAKAYFLGFLKADGYVDKNRDRVALRIQEKDVEILEKFCDCLGFPHSRINKIKARPMEGRNQSDHVEFAITNTQLVTPLLNVKSKEIFDKVPEEFSYDFIRGYFDGDGTISYRNMKKLYFSIAVVGSPSDSHMLEYIMQRVEGFTKIYTDKRSDLPFLKSDNQVVIRRFRDLIYKDAYIYLTRKKTKFDHFSLLFDTPTTRRKTCQAHEDIV